MIRCGHLWCVVETARVTLVARPFAFGDGGVRLALMVWRRVSVCFAKENAVATKSDSEEEPMRSRFLGKTLLAAFGIVAVTSLGVACGGDVKPDVKGAVSVTGSGTGTEPASSQPSPRPSAAAFDYVAEVIAPGEYRSFVYDGPRPTQFQESPEMAELVASRRVSLSRQII